MKIRTLALALLAGVPLAAPAADVSYTHVDLGYVSIDSGGASADGIAADLSYAFDPSFYGVLGLSDIDTTDTFRVGAGWHTGISGSIDLFAEAALLHVDAGPFDDDGYALAVGLRGMANESLELDGRIEHSHVGGSDTALTVGGVWYFSKVGAVVEYTNDDPADAIFIGARFRF